MGSVDLEVPNKQLHSASNRFTVQFVYYAYGSMVKLLEEHLW